MSIFRAVTLLFFITIFILQIRLWLTTLKTSTRNSLQILYSVENVIRPSAIFNLSHKVTSLLLFYIYVRSQYGARQTVIAIFGRTWLRSSVRIEVKAYISDQRTDC
jgi:hypothetical protein